MTDASDVQVIPTGPLDPQTLSVYEVEAWSERLIRWAEDATLNEAVELLDRAAALEEYLARRKLAEPIQTAERNLERRIGELLGPADNGGDRKSDQFPRVETEIDAHSRHRFRLIAEHWELIAPKLPLSRAEALKIADGARKAQQAKPPPSYTVEGWALATAADREQAVAWRGTGGSFNKQSKDSIEWARWSWNPITGCLHNCPYCYARDIANHFPNAFPFGFTPAFHPDRLGGPAHEPVPPEADEDLGWRNVFVCSMADLFGRWVPEEWIRAILACVEENPQWNFLFLTKFPNRLAEFSFPDNAWVGTTVDCQARVKNAEQSFREVTARVKWLSVEPMLEPLDFADLGAFDWVVLGGASASVNTPEWHPPREWSEKLRRDAEAVGCMVYEKTNLLERVRDYPGRRRGDERTLPRELAYIPSIGAS